MKTLCLLGTLDVVTEKNVAWLEDNIVHKLGEICEEVDTATYKSKGLLDTRMIVQVRYKRPEAAITASKKARGWYYDPATRATRGMAELEPDETDSIILTALCKVQNIAKKKMKDRMAGQKYQLCVHWQYGTNF